MNAQHAFLQPFRTDGNPAVTIEGAIARRSNTLAVCYRLSGTLSELAIPPPADAPARKNGLWKKTCFEFFLAEKGLAAYWEFNLSPAGDWNVYRFFGYRQSMQEEAAFTALPFEVQRKSDSLRLSIEIDLNPIVQAGCALDTGISAVIETKEGALTYWALTHSGPHPDFHRREAFILEV